MIFQDLANYNVLESCHSVYKTQISIWTNIIFPSVICVYCYCVLNLEFQLIAIKPGTFGYVKDHMVKVLKLLICLLVHLTNILCVSSSSPNFKLLSLKGIEFI